MGRASLGRGAAGLGELAGSALKAGLTAGQEGGPAGAMGVLAAVFQGDPQEGLRVRAQ